jgi:hypothetical protein
LKEMFMSMDTDHRLVTWGRGARTFVWRIRLIRYMRQLAAKQSVG